MGIKKHHHHIFPFQNFNPSNPFTPKIISNITSHSKLNKENNKQTSPPKTSLILGVRLEGSGFFHSPDKSLPTSVFLTSA